MLFLTLQNVHEYDTWSNSGPLASKVINWVNVTAIYITLRGRSFCECVFAANKERFVRPISRSL